MKSQKGLQALCAAQKKLYVQNAQKKRKKRTCHALFARKRKKSKKNRKKVLTKKTNRGRIMKLSQRAATKMVFEN
ncbi:MAG: hypothetical protein E7624_09440 [Ruminococcaceae bacterium]|nr:hypothetical protein [Oscillospiraceae bacterium]